MYFVNHLVLCNKIVFFQGQIGLRVWVEGRFLSHRKSYTRLITMRSKPNYVEFVLLQLF